MSFDRRLIEANIRGSQAYARALERVGTVTPAERERMVAAFDAILESSRTKPDFYKNAKDEDIHSLVIRELKERAGPVADKIHTGRSRNEQVSLDTRMWLRGEIDATRAQTLDVSNGIAGQADAQISERGNPRLHSYAPCTDCLVAALFTRIL